MYSTISALGHGTANTSMAVLLFFCFVHALIATYQLWHGRIKKGRKKKKEKMKKKEKKRKNVPPVRLSDGESHNYSYCS